MSSSAVNLEKYRIPLDEICVATKNFSSETRVGDGGFGVVHIGQLSEDRRKRTVAVKRLNRDGYQGNNEFYNELKMVSSFNHPNIIPFIGYCDDANEMIIVYEYAVNGSLDRHLQDPEKRSHIPWTQRLNICLGVARGLMYLHSGLGEEDRVIHRDVKSANILLDEKMEAKICDFGLSRFGPRNQPDTRLITKASGTRFYMDPIYNERGRLSKESDIYSFGVVMFEMSSGTLAYHARCFGDAKEQYLMDIVRCCYDDDELDDALDKLIDPTIRDHLDMSSFETFNKIAHECISFNLRKRPTMDRIIEGIKEALDMQEHPSHDHQVRGKSRNTNNQNNMRGSRTNKLSPVDQEGDNYISFGELKAIIQDMKVDQEGDNYISFGELKAIIQDMKFRKKFALEKENTIEEIMKEFDKDGDEKITMDEFVDRFTNWLDEAKHTDTHTLRSTSSWKDLYQVLKPWVESKTNEENTTEDVYWDDGPEDDQTLSRSNRCTWGDLLFSTWHFIKQVMGIFKHETIVAHEENQVNKKRGEPLSSGGVIDDRSNPPRQRDNSRKRLNKEDITQLLQELLDN